MNFRPGAWKVTTDGKLQRIDKSEALGQPDWANHASLTDVALVVKVDDAQQGKRYRGILRSLGVSKEDVSLFEQFHGLEK